MTTDTDPTTAVRASVRVEAPPERAFEVFTAGIDRWWNRSHHVQPGTLNKIGVEPRVGGGLWEENDAGDVCVWGRVLTWDPPRTFAFSWLIGPDWGIPAPDAPGSRVTVTFTPEGAGTRVDLVHDRLDAHGPGWESVRDGVGSDGGWPGGLREYAAAV
ncbi:SRPBCC family protein [Micromonospora soli]|uniref:SRPBCC family protein n=1 Tax=Micromonospora sp. NBRC 110009 TaxID=3061627 RepID=UPI002671F659|nr:SRPBCC family protein [Micromonospora sp. NBRC 110009]WKT99147.1 SRPBCC family protein [Micromonospora sp. NBRC 110009]